ncbi:unnamed protein product (macronuclear) [Paramecium tetraurelia]|uniref:Uncharacterized protein n=1 Tax=Paramecium tetraurelia TaxID=5888 RepID=A0CV88_PARTE|nr:uncharacterized protein GSPATT00010873001 [Paramecium tetraurelia]CAK74705.1 unnamed protein product [Paramecium tetraurelia]|eukprot:XP_001442102.1 hypothetical protein (macronuclear) [Paramecium tetraurelia strain d4-2]
MCYWLWCQLMALGTSSEENVLQLLAELKHNAELELEGLELAWQRRIGEKQSVADSLNQSVLNQRAECQNKEDDIAQKQNDILASEGFINWMSGRQKSNTKKIGVLEASICALTNNYVNDIRNFRYALALVKFLREELAQLEAGASSLAQVTQFHDRVSKFVKLYRSGQLVNLMEKIDDKSDLIVPEIEQGTFDEISLIQRIRPKALTQLDQAADDDDKANNAVVLIPGCDNQIGTVVVVQNDDGTTDSGDLNVKITNGGGVSTKPTGGKSGSGSGSGSPQIHKDPISKKDEKHHQEEHVNSGDSDDSDDQGDSGDNQDAGDNNDSDNSDDTKHSDDTTHSDDGDNTSDEDHPQIVIDDKQPDHHVDEQPNIAVPTKDPHGTGAVVPPGEEEFADNWEGFRKLLDAIENHTKKSLETGANDEVRSNLGFIDFKLHIELENQFFDKTIQYEKDYLVKQVNQLTGRRQASILCGARLKQITVAHQVALKDIDAAKQFYEEQRKLKQEEVNTFDDVYRIYTTQVNH